LENDSSNNERQILKKVATGDEQAFKILVEEYGAVIYSHVIAYIKNVSRAEEITQDIFIAVWRHRQQLPDLQNFRGYLFVLTRNRAISAFREKILRYDEAEKDQLLTNINPGEILEYRQLSEILRRGINQLSERRKEIFMMSRFDGKTYDQIAHHFNISKSAVNKHIIEALAFLRTFLRNEMGAFITAIFLGCIAR
jgi:RNA polymerase sigma-70 factor (family 1)